VWPLCIAEEALPWQHGGSLAAAWRPQRRGGMVASFVYMWEHHGKT